MSSRAGPPGHGRTLRQAATSQGESGAEASARREKRPYRIAALLSAAAVTCAIAAAAQTTPGLPLIGAGPRGELPLLVPRGLTPEQAEAFKSAFADYQQCTRERADEMRLTEAADNVILLRDRRTFWAAEFQRNTSLRLQWGDYARALAAGFQEYKALGGPAPTIEEVQRIKAPCTNPAETTTGPRIPITDSKKMIRPAP